VNKLIPKLTESDLARFWAKVDKRGPDNCWEWTACTLKSGYGHFKIGDSNYIATRVSYMIANDEDPGGLCVCHECDNPPCVNPSHLWLGTFQEDMKDRDQKKRQAHGETMGSSVLTENQVQEILGSRETHQDIADRYGVAHCTIYQIKCGKAWEHVEGERVKDTTRARKDSTLGIKGITPTKSGNFQAYVQRDGKRRYLGTFDTIEEAAEAVQKARLL